MLLSVVAVLTFAAAPAEPALSATGQDPTKCRVVLEDVRGVGLRISDAQQLSTAVVEGLRARIGYEAVVFEGQLRAMEDIQRRIGTLAEPAEREGEIAYLTQAVATAPFRVKLRFGRKKSGKARHYATLSCRNKGAPAGQTLDELTVRATSFRKLKTAVSERIPTFCRLVDPAPAGGDAASQRRKKKKPFVLPPRR